MKRGGADDAGALLELFDDAIAWAVARGDTRQWGAQPFSARPAEAERVERWAAEDELWFAVAADGERVGAMVLGEHQPYVSAPERPELYVQVLLTHSAWRGRGVGARLIERAVEVARAAGAEQLRVDCWDGVPELPDAYERLGFTRTGSFEVKGWPGAILVRELE